MKIKNNTSILLCAIGLLLSSLAYRSIAAEKTPAMSFNQAFNVLKQHNPGLFHTPLKPLTRGTPGVQVLSGGGDQRAQHALVKKQLQEIRVTNVPNFHGWTLTHFSRYIHQQGATVVVDVNINADYLRILRKMNNERLLTDLPITETVEVGRDTIVRPEEILIPVLPKLNPDKVKFNGHTMFKGEWSLAEVLRISVPQFDVPLKYEIRNGAAYIMQTTEEQRQESRFGTFAAKINPFRLSGVRLGNRLGLNVGYAPGYGPSPARAYSRPQPAPPVMPGTGGVNIEIIIFPKP